MAIAFMPVAPRTEYLFKFITRNDKVSKQRVVKDKYYSLSENHTMSTTGVISLAQISEQASAKVLASLVKRWSASLTRLSSEGSL